MSNAAEMTNAEIQAQDAEREAAGLRFDVWHDGQNWRVSGSTFSADHAGRPNFATRAEAEEIASYMTLSGY